MIFCVKLDWATESSPSPKDVGNKSRRELGFGRDVVHSMIIKFYFIFFISVPRQDTIEHTTLRKTVN